MSDDPGQSPAHVVALADQIHAAIRDKDSDRLADTVRALFYRDPEAARAMLMEGLRQAIGIEDEDDPPEQSDGVTPLDTPDQDQ